MGHHRPGGICLYTADRGPSVNWEKATGGYAWLTTRTEALKSCRRFHSSKIRHYVMESQNFLNVQGSVSRTAKDHPTGDGPFYGGANGANNMGQWSVTRSDSLSLLVRHPLDLF